MAKPVQTFKSADGDLTVMLMPDDAPQGWRGRIMFLVNRKMKGMPKAALTKHQATELRDWLTANLRRMPTQAPGQKA